MADINSSSFNKAAQCGALVKIIPVLAIGLILAACGGSSPPPAAPIPATAPKAVPTSAAPAPAGTAPAAAPVPELTVEQLVKEAGTAFREQRYVAPQGNNALEYYLRVLDKDANNQIAQSALREMFPFATGAVEQDINTGNVDEANRVIDLLAKNDPSNYTLTILRSKLDAKKKQVDREQAVTAAAAAATAAKAAATQNAAAAPAAPSAATPAPVQAAAAPPPEPAPAPKPVAPPPPPTPVAAAPVGESHPAQLVKSATPDYPVEAYRDHKQGWVEVAFTVDSAGQVTDPKVVNAEPARIFNSAALSAVKRWTFKPRMENGKAVAEQMQRRIEFKLGG